MKITKGIFTEFAYSSALPGFVDKTEQEISDFLSFCASDAVSSSCEIESRSAFGVGSIFISANEVTLSRPNEAPTAGISLGRYFPTVLSYLPPAAIELLSPGRKIR